QKGARSEIWAFAVHRGDDVTSAQAGFIRVAVRIAPHEGIYGHLVGRNLELLTARVDRHREEARIYAGDAFREGRSPIGNGFAPAFRHDPCPGHPSPAPPPPPFDLPGTTGPRMPPAANLRLAKAPPPARRTEHIACFEAGLLRRTAPHHVRDEQSVVA